MASALCYKNDEFAFITTFELEVGHQSPLQCITGAPGQTSFIAGCNVGQVRPHATFLLGGSDVTLGLGLPTELKLLRSTTTFCCQLQTFLFQSAYGHRDTD